MPKGKQRLPTVLSLKEVWTILNMVITSQNKAYLTTIYTCGLRLHEALYLQGSDIDSRRLTPVLVQFKQGHEYAYGIINSLMKGDHHDDNQTDP